MPWLAKAREALRVAGSGTADQRRSMQMAGWEGAHYLSTEEMIG